jgi:hypothetical protein
MLSAYRASGAELPFADPSRHRGAGIEGYFWRFTDVAAGRVLVALAAVSRDGAAPPWGLVALAAHPGGLVRSAASPLAWGDPRGPGLLVGELLRADADSLRVDLGPGARLQARLVDRERWPRRVLGAMGPAQLAPGLSQYWHPHLLRAAVRGSAEVGEATWSLDAASAYAEKNWGPGGMPPTWWWGQAHGFEREDVTVAFAGGPAAWGPLRLTGTALVVALGGEVVRLVHPLVPMAVAVDESGWRLRARTPRHRVEVEASGAGGPPPVLLPVPVPGEGRHLDAVSPQYLAGALRVHVSRRGRTLFGGESTLAGLERGRGHAG